MLNAAAIVTTPERVDRMIDRLAGPDAYLPSWATIWFVRYCPVYPETMSPAAVAAACNRLFATNHPTTGRPLVGIPGLCGLLPDVLGRGFDDWFNPAVWRQAAGVLFDFNTRGLFAADSERRLFVDLEPFFEAPVRYPTPADAGRLAQAMSIFWDTADILRLCVWTCPAWWGFVHLLTAPRNGRRIVTLDEATYQDWSAWRSQSSVMGRLGFGYLPGIRLKHLRRADGAAVGAAGIHGAWGWGMASDPDDGIETLGTRAWTVPEDAPPPVETAGMTMAAGRSGGLWKDKLSDLVG